jgi:16S rRNA (uracil1498-N3)-methyltransferase
MRTFFDSNSLGSNDFIYLDEVESHHLMKVLRLREGDEVEALDGKGNKYLTEIYKTDHKQVELKILHKNFFAQEKPTFRLAVALSKGNRWEDMIRPLTELGVTRITPLLTDHSEYKNIEKKLDSKIKKWQKIAIDACKQSGNPWMPHFDFPETFTFFLQNIKEGEKIFIGSLSKSSKSIKDLEIGAVDQASILIGPEGGWSEKEIELAEENGFSAFSLGSSTLRLETAAICGLAVARESFIL